MEAVAYIICAVGAYLLGSIPTGFLVAKAKGVDIRTVGSGNMGATNVFRVLGKGPGTLVLLVDALKGWVAAWPWAFLVWHVGGKLMGGHTDSGTSVFRCPPPNYVDYSIIAGFAAILGHNYTCWLKFKGGKGIATSAGVLLALIPWTLLVAFAAFVVCFAATRYVSVGSLAASVAVPVATWFFYESTTLRVVAFLMGALAIYKHRANIQRLLNGTESRFGKKKEPAPTEAAQ